MSDLDYAMGAASWLDAKALQGYQDRLDGAALRRLREVSDDAQVTITSDDDGFVISVVASRDDIIEDGATIAEAADKCREALP